MCEKWTPVPTTIIKHPSSSMHTSRTKCLIISRSRFGFQLTNRIAELFLLHLSDALLFMLTDQTIISSLSSIQLPSPVLRSLRCCFCPLDRAVYSMLLPDRSHQSDSACRIACSLHQISLFLQLS